MAGPAGCPAEFIAFAHQLAEAAGAAIRPHFRRLSGVETKSDASPVTVADRASERAMRDLIERHYPEHGIFGEEFGTVRPDAEYLWILDPIDGTKSFVAGLPIFGTLIALARRGTALLGVIDQPITGERWIGASGHPTTFNGATVRCDASRTRLADAVLFSTSVGVFEPEDERRFNRLARQVRIPRLSGDCYAYGLVASGYGDLVVESEVKPYDFAALIPVIQGAGGFITDWAGRPLDLGRDSRVVAAGNRAILDAALAILAG
jgi:inositol-phosphate phosphatase/L-galactose 1-phosphate phosphatase/histidinol-phosphatase